MAQLGARSGDRDLERWMPKKQLGAMAVVLVGDVGQKPGAAVGMQSRQGMGTMSE